MGRPARFLSAQRTGSTSHKNKMSTLCSFAKGENIQLFLLCHKIQRKNAAFNTLLMSRREWLPASYPAFRILQVLQKISGHTGRGCKQQEERSFIMDSIIHQIADWAVSANDFVNGIVWGVPMLMLIGCVGLYYTIRLHGVQFRKFKEIFKNTIGNTHPDGDRSKAGADSGKALTSFQAAMTSVSAVVGSGNIAGVATALVCGGPGALFWMCLVASLGMATKYAEIVLGILYRRKNPDGTYEGGAMYYLADGLHQPWLGKLFAFLVIPFAFVVSAVVDTNTMATTFEAQFSIDPLVSGIVLAALTGIVIFGGVKRIGKVCEWLSPIMGGMYVLAGLSIILLHLDRLPTAVASIIYGAFNPSALTGGAIGSIFMCMRYGIARGMFSNEAGLGTTAMIHSGADVSHPIKQAMWGPMEVFLDTIIICNVTGLPIVMSGLWSGGEFDGATLTMRAFEKLLPGSIGMWICLLAVLLFGFSCLISCYTYALRASTYLFGKKSIVVIKTLWLAFIVIGAQSTLGFVWNLADTFNGLMIIPNLVGLMLLSRQVLRAHNDYWGVERSAVCKSKRMRCKHAH